MRDISVGIGPEVDGVSQASFAYNGPIIVSEAESIATVYDPEPTFTVTMYSQSHHKPIAVLYTPTGAQSGSQNTFHRTNKHTLYTGIASPTNRHHSDTLPSSNTHWHTPTFENPHVVELTLILDFPFF